MTICLPEWLVPPLSTRQRRCDNLTLLLLLLITLCLPLPVGASTNQQVEEAVKLLEQKEYVLALELLNDLESRLLNPGQISRLFAYAYLGRGYQLLSASDFPAAREAFSEGRRYDGNDVRFWQGEVMATFQQGYYAEAVSLLDQALGIAPQNAELYHLLGQAYYADGRMAEALDALHRSSDLGGGTDVAALLEKVRREWQIEQEMGLEVRGHFQLSFVDGVQGASLAPEILEVLEDAYAELGSDLSYYPDVKVPILLYARRDFSSVTNSPDWAGAVYDGKVRLPLGGLRHMNDQLKAMLYHEYMHVLVHYMANRQVPVWLNEGLAETAGRRIFPLPLTALRDAVASRRLIDWDQLSRPFTALAESEVRLAYEQSYSMVHFMIDRFGWHKMTELLARLGKRQAWVPAVTVVYRDYGLDWPAIIVEWQASLK